MPHPLLIGWIMKQASVFNLYAAAKAYGFHRVYRRLLEANRRLVSSKEDRRIVQATIKDAMRAPTKVVEVLEESHTVAFLQAYAKELTSGLEARAPPFFVTAARIVLTKTPLGKMFDIFEDWRGSVRRNNKSSGAASASGSGLGSGSDGSLPVVRREDGGDDGSSSRGRG